MIDDVRYKKLVKDLLSKEVEVISHLYDVYGDAIYGIIVRIVKNESIASELLQNTFVKVWQNAESYDPDKGRLFTWIMRIARNLSINEINSKQYRQQNKIQMIDKSVYNISAAETSQSELSDIAIHVKNLDQKYSEAIELVFFKGFTHEDASKLLKLPLGTLKSRIRIALRELKKVYDYNQSELILILGFVLNLP